MQVFNYSTKLATGYSIYVYTFKHDGELIVPKIRKIFSLDGKRVVFNEGSTSIVRVEERIPKRIKQNGKTYTTYRTASASKTFNNEIPAFEYRYSANLDEYGDYYFMYVVYPPLAVKRSSADIETISPVINIYKLEVNDSGVLSISSDTVDNPPEWMCLPFEIDASGPFYAAEREILNTIKNQPDDEPLAPDVIKSMERRAAKMRSAAIFWEEYISRYPVKGLIDMRNKYSIYA